MKPDLILLPLLAQVLLTIVVYLLLGIAKNRALAAGEVDLARRGVYDDAWPEPVIRINNNISNQFGVPVLFYVLTLALWQLGETGLLAHSLAWLFVLSRVLHAWIHIGPNIVNQRRRVFSFGVLVVLAMAVLTAVAVL